MPSRVRSRTLAHLEALLAVGALSGCRVVVDPGYGVVDPMPMPATPPPTEDLSPPGVIYVGTPPPVTPPATIPEVTPPPVAPPPVTPPPVTPPYVGYGVVDPMPPPAECRSFSEALYATAEYKLDGVHVRLYTSNSARGHVFLDARVPVDVRGAKVDQDRVDSTTWLFRMVPDPASHELSFTATGTCEGASARATVHVSWSTPEAGSTVNAYVSPEGK